MKCDNTENLLDEKDRIKEKFVINYDIVEICQLQKYTSLKNVILYFNL